MRSPFEALRAVTAGSRARYLAGVMVFILAGGLFAASAIISRGTDLRSDQVASLQDLVRDSSQRVARLQRRVGVQRVKVEALGLAADAPGLAQAEKALSAIRPRAGGTAVSGTAVRVTLDDAPESMRLQPDVDPNDLVVHQQDVQAVVNAMWRGGARAVQVMDQRIVGTSAIKCVGNTLLIQGRVYSPPFTVTAVGTQAPLLRSLQDDPDVIVYRDYANAFGLGWEVERLSDFTAPAFSIPSRLRWAAQLPAGGDTGSAAAPAGARPSRRSAQP